MSVTLITNIADTLQPFIIYKLSDFLDQSRLIDLIRDFCNNNDVALLTQPFDCRARANRELAAASLVSVTYSTTAVNDTGSWKIGTWDVGHEIALSGLRIVDEMDRR